MKKQPTLIAIATSLLFVSNFAAAESKHEGYERHARSHVLHARPREWHATPHVSHARPERPIKAPEISIASGIVPIALLAGVLLLMGEKNRTRRP